MVNALLDTSIVIDLLRKYHPAEAWLRGYSEPLGIPHSTWYELVIGASNRQEENHALTLLSKFQLIEPEPIDHIRTAEYLIKFNLNHDISVFDCLTAAIGGRLQIPVYTQDMNDFILLVIWHSDHIDMSLASPSTKNRHTDTVDGIGFVR